MNAIYEIFELIEKVGTFFFFFFFLSNFLPNLNENRPLSLPAKAIENRTTFNHDFH